MLVLTRKKDEKVLIGDIVVHILRVGGNFVRLGIEAPPDVNIKRGELPIKSDAERDHIIARMEAMGYVVSRLSQTFTAESRMDAIDDLMLHGFGWDVIEEALKSGVPMPADEAKMFNEALEALRD